MAEQVDEKKQTMIRARREQRRRIRILSWVAVPLLIILFIVGAFSLYLTMQGTQVVSVSEAPKEESYSAEVEDLTIEYDSTPKSLRLVMVGDILMHDKAIASGLKEDGTYDYDAIFANTRDVFQSADIAIVNEEAIIGGEELGISGYPDFNVGYELGDALANAGFNVICYATNHVYDRQEQGILNVLNFWEENYPGINVVGIHHAEDADPLCLMEFGNITIGILNYTDIMNYGSLSLTETTIDRLTQSTKESVTEDLQRARELADFVVVIPHWGEEYQTTVSSDQREWARLFLENGVDLVIGSHPHVIEPVEWLEDDEGHRMLCYYSLGDFVEYSNKEYAGMYKYALGAMADVTLSIQDGEVSIADYGAVPTIVQMGEGFGETTVYFLKDYTEELLEENYMHKVDYAFTIENCKEFFREVIGDAYQE